MRKVIFALTFLVTSFTLYAQNESAIDEKRKKYGINLGVNYSNLIGKGLPTDIAISNNAGFHLGILMSYKLSRTVYIAPKAEISFNGSQLNFINPNGSQDEYLAMPIHVGLMAHFVFKKNQNDPNPYIYLGPNVKFPITSPTTLFYPTKADLGLDIGIGLEKIMTYFNFAPELRYSFGLININQTQSIESLYFHNVSFIVNFAG